MRWILNTAVVVGLLLGLAGQGCAQPPAPPPPVAAQDSICRPELRVGDMQYRAGVAFLLGATNSPRTLLVTAHHLFGPDGGAEAQVPWNEMPDRARMIGCTAYGSGETWRAAAPLAISGAHPGFDQAAMLDMAAFPLTGTTTQPRLQLAPRAPAVGDSVWLVAEIIAPPADPGLLHHAVVAQITDHYLVVVYDHPIGMTATSGGPIVDRDGHVVGVNFGGGVSQSSGRMLGLATSWAAINAAMASLR